jgi:hypothetical protein
MDFLQTKGLQLQPLVFLCRIKRSGLIQVSFNSYKGLLTSVAFTLYTTHISLLTEQTTVERFNVSAFGEFILKLVGGKTGNG